jgi:hypothetical protein
MVVERPRGANTRRREPATSFWDFAITYQPSLICQRQCLQRSNRLRGANNDVDHGIERNAKMLSSS